MFVLFLINADAYGALGRDGVVPANTPVEVDLELVSWKRVSENLY